MLRKTAPAVFVLSLATWQGDLLPSSTVDVSLEECPGWLVWGDTLMPDMGRYLNRLVIIRKLKRFQHVVPSSDASARIVNQGWQNCL